MLEMTTYERNYFSQGKLYVHRKESSLEVNKENENTCIDY